ncbi:uncharacterized protein LOC110807579 [Carica papaya]|uniref:uncharacterized protein LOC110807579 n=1 Tax=Carica papaya TaxID=3649 RepID=UPI000B8CB202|nr:uncharacterized protein LOC110807579 [Carica papaya]
MGIPRNSIKPKMATYNIVSCGVTVKTTVTNSATFTDDYITELVLSCNHVTPLIGLDVRSARSGVTGEMKAATLTLCSGSRCIIIQLTNMDSIPDSLISFLSAPLFHFVGIWESLAILEKDYGIVCRNVIELDPFLFSLVVALEIKVESKPSSVMMGNWGAGNLSMEQIQAVTFLAHSFFECGKFFFT